MGKPKWWNSPEKWGDRGGGGALKWWNTLSEDEKRKFKAHYEQVREWNFKKRNPYPNMYDTTQIRVSKLSQKQIYRIWVFREHTQHLN